MKSQQIIAPDWFKIIVGLPFIIALLWFGRDLFKLLAVAFLVFILATAFTDRLSLLTIRGNSLSGWKSRPLALVIFVFAIWLFALVSSNAANEIVEALPRYQEPLGEIVLSFESIIGTRGVETIQQAADSLQVGSLVLSLANGFVGSVAQFALLTLYFLFLVAERTDWTQKIALLSSSARERDRSRPKRWRKCRNGELAWRNGENGLVRKITVEAGRAAP